MTCALEALFQPIVDTVGLRILGHECGTGELAGSEESVLIRAAGAQSPDGLYFIRAESLMPNFGAMLESVGESGLRLDNLVLEVPEYRLVQNPRHWRGLFERYRELGFRLAIADAGTGPHSLQALADLQPDYLKLEKTLVRNVERLICTVKIRQLADLGERLGIPVVADGVDRQVTLEDLWLLTVSLMQGSLFGDPSPTIVQASAAQGETAAAHSATPPGTEDANGAEETSAEGPSAGSSGASG